MKNFFLFLFMILIYSTVSAQVKDYELGSPANTIRNYNGGYFDYSDPTTVNIKVSVWGFVKYPGRYTVPINSTAADLLSFAGGPTDDAHLDDLRLYKLGPDSSQSIVKFDYNDLLWEETLRTTKVVVPNLTAGDILVVPGSPRLYFKDWFSITLSVVSTLISLSILVLNIIRY
ncbi:MAG: hypothetical protein CO129_01470 [Ignavibacteriales bacterium CG_4_9_14_3_um_filter_34_10]|nr:MAG: hypothetical protein CO129_01470 [Ignavibacteriales bacterium CG_4_9_14_3_um_filter_34_10]